MSTPLTRPPQLGVAPGFTVREMIGHFAALLSYALYDRTQPTDVDRALSALVVERHANFHADRYGEDWTKCGNEACIEVRRVLERARLPRLMMNALEREMMDTQFNLKVDPMPGGSLAVVLVPARAVQAVAPTTDAPAAERPSGLLIVGG